MKKIAILFVAVALLASCGSSAVVDEARATMRGDWTLTNVTFPGDEEDLKVTLLNDIPVSCLENSSWNFISNNNTGSFETTGLACENGPHFFIWSIDEVDEAGGNYDLMFKPTDADFDSTTGNIGYRINLTNLTGNSMVWEQTINFEGKPFTIQMNFNKL